MPNALWHDWLITILKLRDFGQSDCMIVTIGAGFTWIMST